MTESELNVLKAQHERWVSDPHTSRGQRTDSQDILKLIAEVERLKEALEFYAAKRLYVNVGLEQELYKDQGERARQALKGDGK